MLRVVVPDLVAAEDHGVQAFRREGHQMHALPERPEASLAPRHGEAVGEILGRAHGMLPPVVPPEPEGPGQERRRIVDDVGVVAQGAQDFHQGAGLQHGTVIVGRMEGEDAYFLSHFFLNFTIFSAMWWFQESFPKFRST